MLSGRHRRSDRWRGDPRIKNLGSEILESVTHGILVCTKALPKELLNHVLTYLLTLSVKTSCFVVRACIEPADEHVEGGIYISPEFQLGQVYDGAADVVEDVILYRPVYVCAPRPPGSDIGNGHSPSVRGVDHTPSPSPVAGSPSAAGRPARAGGVTPSGSVEHVNAHSSPSHGKTTATRTTKKVESTTTTTTVDSRSNEHHHQHHHHHHHRPPHQPQKEELSEPLQHTGRSSHEVIVHGSLPASERGSRDLDPAKPTATAAAATTTTTTHDDVRLTDVTGVSATKSKDGVVTEACDTSVHGGKVDDPELTVSSKHIRITTTTSTTTTAVVVSPQPSATAIDSTADKDHIAAATSPGAVAAAASVGDCNSTSVSTYDHCVDPVSSADRDAANSACNPTPTN